MENIFKENKNVELINMLQSECQERLENAKSLIETSKFGTAKDELYNICILLDTLQTLDKGSKWVND